MDMPEILNTIVPRQGQVWYWEPERPHARCMLTVLEVKWDGEEVWIKTKQHRTGEENWNELSRWVEATVLVSVPPYEE